MRRLIPGPVADVDAFDLYADAPDVRIGMVASADGSATDEHGWTDGLGGEADLRVFRALRAHADGIMMGAATLRSGRVGPHRMRADLRARRAAAGRPDPAPVIVVSRSLELDWTLPVFTAAVTPTIVVTRAAVAGRLPGDVRAVVAGDAEVDLAAALGELRRRFGVRRLLCEGGPTLAGALVAAGLADELCLTVAPVLIGAAHHTPPLALACGAAARLTGVAEDEGTLFLRYALTNYGEAFSAYNAENRSP